MIRPHTIKKWSPKKLKSNKQILFSSFFLIIYGSKTCRKYLTLLVLKFRVELSSTFFRTGQNNDVILGSNSENPTRASRMIGAKPRRGLISVIRGYKSVWIQFPPFKMLISPDLFYEGKQITCDYLTKE